MNITIKEVTDTGNPISNGTLVKCPKCGADSPHSTHLKGIVSFGDYDHRREAVELQFECQSGGHKFSVFYRQHKGDTFVEIV
jgi:hypothetical protein